MYLRDLFASLRRRWYFLVVVLAATAAMVFAALSLIPPRFSSSASVVLLPPATSVESGGNPYMLLGGLSQTVDVLVRAMSTDSIHEAVKAEVPGGTFEAVADWSTSGPILIVTSEASTPRETLAAQQAALAQVPTALAALQTQISIAKDAQITSMEIAAGSEPTRVTKTMMRAAVGAGVVGLAGGAVLIGALDGWLLRRRERAPLRGRRRRGEVAAERVQLAPDEPVTDVPVPPRPAPEATSPTRRVDASLR